MRKLKVLVAMFAMVFLAASPAMAQQIEFVDGGVFVAVEGVATLEEPPVTGVAAIPGLFTGTVAGGDAFAVADQEFGVGFAEASLTTFAGGGPEFGFIARAGDICIDTTDRDFCP